MDNRCIVLQGGLGSDLVKHKSRLQVEKEKAARQADKGAKPAMQGTP